jgi:hypothetical protein
VPHQIVIARQFPRLSLILGDRTKNHRLLDQYGVKRERVVGFGDAAQK